MDWLELKKQLERIFKDYDISEPARPIEIPQHAKDLLSWQRRLKKMKCAGYLKRKELKKNYHPKYPEWYRHMMRRLTGPSLIDGIGPRWLR